MKKQHIQVYDYTLGHSIMHPRSRFGKMGDFDWDEYNVLDVEAYCVGGVDGVQAIFEHESFPPGCVGIASGDDGNWWLVGVIHKHWLPGWIDALQAILKNN